MASFLVRRPFRANGHDYVTGETFSGDALHLRKLLEQRYLTEDPQEVPAPAPLPAPVEAAVPAPRKRGRPRKNPAADAASPE